MGQMRGETDVTTVLHKFIIFFCITWDNIYKTMVLFLTLLIIFHILFFFGWRLPPPPAYKCSVLSGSDTVPFFDDVLVCMYKLTKIGNLNMNTRRTQNKLLFYMLRRLFEMEHFFPYTNRISQTGLLYEEFLSDLISSLLTLKCSYHESGLHTSN